MKMHDAELNIRAWKNGFDRFREACETVDTGNEDVADTSVMEFC